MFGMGWGELLVLAAVGLFVLGPERLPGAIRWVTGAVAQAKGYLDTAKQQLDSPEFDSVREPLQELREPLAELRSLHPRNSLKHVLRDPTTPGAATTTADDQATGQRPAATPPQ